MKEININNFKEKLYYEKLPNGFEVFLVPLKNKKNYYIDLCTKYGGRDINFKVDDKTYKVPSGIAHFLEHKMFEKEDNPFMFFQKSGTDVNASTSYDFTSYHLTGNSKFKKNLTYLLKWLKNLNITEEQVEKEKGIILEEASMYKDNPERVLQEKSKNNVFITDPYKYKVIGKDEDIKNITKKDIELCYDTFYNANNMFIICVGNFNETEAIEIIRNEVKDYKVSQNNIEKIYGEEKDQVCKEYEELKMNIDITRVCSSYKLNKKELKKLNLTNYEEDLYLHILIDVGLGIGSDIWEKFVKEKLFISAFYRVIEIDTHYIIEFNVITERPDDITKKLDKYLQNIILEEEAFEREKKVWIAGEIKNINNIHSIGYSILDDILDYNEFIPNKIDIIKNLDYKTLLKVKESLDFKNKSIVKIIPNK